MKRGKDDDMSTEPMFPRLHVNDTADKGGPRAPPRNKMALYEQLSIPSQRFGSSLNPRIQTGLASPASSSQVSGAEKNTSNPIRLNPLTATPFSDVQPEERKKTGDTNELFSDPVFVKSTVSHGKIHHCTDRDSVSSIISPRSRLPENATVRKEREDNVILAADLPPIPSEVVDGNTREAEASADRDRQRGNGLVESTGDDPRSESRRADGKRSRNSVGGACISLRLEKVDKCDDDFSEKSMLESIYGSDIAPDDVVEIIGQKHFWKARTAIVNQQRVFAIQVFELHRLVKVQKLIAGSPEVLIGNGTFMQKSRTPSTKLPPKFAAKPLPFSEKPPSHKTECSTVNTAKPPLSSTKSLSQSSNHGATESKTDPWHFHQPPPGGPQWLVPVMSPSEGLIYKPYPGPGIPGPIYGGNGPSFGPIPGFGVQPPHHQETRMVFPGTSPSGHTFFPPPYSMPLTGSAGESANLFTSPIPQIVIGGGGLKAERQSSSCNAPNARKTVSVSRPSKFEASRGSDLQMGSTDSSPGERRDPGPLFPVAPVVSERDSRSHVADQPNRVIKVVPHSRRSATESAARIFRFIQEERKQPNYV